MSAKRKILLIEDDTALRQSLSEQLELYKEFSLSEAGTGIEGLEMAKNGQFDIILLDVGLPDMDGREVCRLMRQAGVNVPIPMPIPFSALTPAPTTMCQNLSASAFCWRESGPSCASTSRAKTRSLPSVPIILNQETSC